MEGKQFSRYSTHFLLTSVIQTVRIYITVENVERGYEVAIVINIFVSWPTYINTISTLNYNRWYKVNN